MSPDDLNHVLDMAGAWIKHLENEGDDAANRKRVHSRVILGLAARDAAFDAMLASCGQMLRDARAVYGADLSYVPAQWRDTLIAMTEAVRKARGEP